MSNLNNISTNEIQNEITAATPVFVHPFDINHDSREYTLHYRHGNNPNCLKNFTYKGSFREAMQRAKQHCEKMGYRFILLRPAISNLEDDERIRENGITI